jgi:hypothetical protein
MAEDRLAGAATDGARSLRLRTMDRAPASQSGFATAERVGDVSASFVVRHRQICDDLVLKARLLAAILVHTFALRRSRRHAMSRSTNIRRRIDRGE